MRHEKVICNSDRHCRLPSSEGTALRSCINLGYTYAISEKWDFNFVVDAVSQFYTQEKFRSIDLVNPDGSVAEGREYDWNSEPVSVKHSSRWWVSFNFDFRWKWYCTDAVRLYTAFGLGYLPSRIPILPYIAPVGINFGANHFYGVAELNFSPAASIILLGAGYRF